MRAENTKAILTLGFGAVLGLMGMLGAAGLSVLDAGVKRLDEVVHAHHVKRELIARMRTAARERTLSLHKMLVLKDLFDLDAEWMHFNELAGSFIAARVELEELVETPEEQALLARQAELSRQVSPAQTEVAHLILTERLEQARRVLLQTVIPGQDRTFQVLSRLMQYQKDASELALREAREDYRDAVATMTLAGLGVAVLGILVAVTVIRRTSLIESRLMDAKERAQVTLHSIGEAVVTTDPEGRIEQLNAAAETLAGWSNDEARGMPLCEVFSLRREDGQPAQDAVSRVLRERRVVACTADCLLERRDGAELAVEHTAAPILDHGRGGVAGVILVFRDVTETRTLADRLAHQARHDALTGLINRRELEQRLDEALAEVRRYPDQEHWFCYIDLDQFKVINDTCGHIAGDELLKQVAMLLRDKLRETDVVARMGGDEFAVLLRHTGAHEVHETVERLRRGLSRVRFAWADKSFTINASIGLVPVNAHSGSVSDVLSAADKACYVAKDEGRNRIHVYRPDDDTMARREGEMEWVHRINRALEEDRFVLYSQLIEPLQRAHGRTHCEILVRILDAGGNTVPPMAFIPAAERYNLMSEVDRWVLRNALARFSARCQAGDPGDCTLSINLSTQSLCDDGFLPFALEQLDRCPVDPTSICFEITETSAVANLSRARQFIDALRRRGCRFSLDDFGAGLSSFAYLKSLPVDFLKIDGTFVRDICDDPMDRALVESIHQIGAAVGIETIAEYVETPGTLEALREIGVNYAQGVALAEPEPFDDLLRRLAALDAGHSACCSLK
ncbi:MAG: EAL domain-containing protein [Gammaproteobacteria bacterium]|nr:EAL domain-containing protein [Gammaproteobacteria bacterium]NIR96933.1 EAL domain-containing protein [Gammaproteobacteria bacterium]NIT62635.1 EAL domain-containing protein [Gammaproteobacteria bacterium]NIV19595.1 EAL domain-containing protein [Gammaproteobacteria bacterium]NIX10815.1 EAL domain-containing protein [Gammaproteobacteria bacterium]